MESEKTEKGNSVSEGVVGSRYRSHSVTHSRTQKRVLLIVLAAPKKIKMTQLTIPLNTIDHKKTFKKQNTSFELNNENISYENCTL